LFHFYQIEFDFVVPLALNSLTNPQAYND